MFNEPDVGPEDVPNATQYYYGAWVLNEDYYAAGVRYGEMTAVVYPLVKAACPSMQLISGALAGNDPQSLFFLRGMLDGGLQTDYISFHKYVYTQDQFNSVFEFAETITEITDLSLIASETNLVSAIGGFDHEALKAKYMTYLREHIQNSGITSVLIYGMCNTWMNSALAPNCVPGEAFRIWASQ